LASTQPALLRAAREKLRQWKLSDSQIDRLEAGGDLPDVDIRADASGVVTQRKVAQGDYVKPGSPLFDLADLSSVWVVFDAYEQDLPFLKKGETVNYQLESLPGKTFSGKIVFIDPLLDPATRTAKLRVESRNPGMQLKPGMYAEATVKATLPNAAEQVLVPRTAVLWTGKRSLVYVKQDASAALAFLPREVELGPQMGEDYVILAGLRPGEEVVTRGAFAVDASAQLEGKRSMMDEK
ncbi:MAG: efflux RND transporter periplasmic adaptor subunit, partial [Tannerella sp.]|jgi:Cu(I)/Ag(I) efflux system membrane fusion protein|nr:efflux RND transporter periplasmic adaptor subunit [Tannerella sp.]